MEQDCAIPDHGGSASSFRLVGAFSQASPPPSQASSHTLSPDPDNLIDLTGDNNPRAAKPPSESSTEDQTSAGDKVYIDLTGHGELQEPQSPIDPCHEVISLEDEDLIIEESITDLKIEHIPGKIAVEELEAKVEEQLFRQPRSQRGVIPTRNPPLVWPLTSLETCSWGVWTLKQKKVVEIADGNFLTIKCIVKDTRDGNITLRGWESTRIKHLGGKLERGKNTKNELAYLHEVDMDDPRPMLEQSVREVSLKEVTNIRRVNFTNKTIQEAPELRYDRAYVPNIGTHREKMIWVEKNDILVLRWMFIRKYKNALERRAHNINPGTANFYSYTLRPLLEAECGPGLGKSSTAQRRQWRAGTNSRNDDEVEFLGEKVRKYTLFDTFCGCGGTSRGAQAAGLEVKYAFDSWGEAEKTYKVNFPSTEFHKMTVHSFCVSSLEERRSHLVDVLHISCPCQYFSPNHTQARGACPNDADNYAASFCVNPLVKLTRARIVHSEQTFGFLWNEFELDFNMFLSQFTDLGYSVSWQVREFHKDGLPQRRRRLLMYAAAPGETLPEFPAYTHSENRFDGLKPLTTAKDVLRQIPQNAPSHNVRAATTGRKYPVWDDAMQTPTICTAGLQKDNRVLGHPSGLRKLTPTELAGLQGMPSHHIFPSEKSIVNNKLIGNVYPSSMAKIHFENIRKHLEKTDEAERWRDAAPF